MWTCDGRLARNKCNTNTLPDIASRIAGTYLLAIDTALAAAPVVPVRWPRPELAEHPSAPDHSRTSWCRTPSGGERKGMSSGRGRGRSATCTPHMKHPHLCLHTPPYAHLFQQINHDVSHVQRQQRQQEHGTTDVHCCVVGAA